MSVSANLDNFLNKRVEQYTPGTPIANTDEVVYRLGVSYEDEDLTIDMVMDAFTKDPKAGEIKELIIGAFELESSENSDVVVEKLIGLNSTFKNLKAIFLGDITFDECEISWIQQSDMAPLLNAYPQLEHFQVRGGDGLRFSDLRHDNLKTLIIETGGLYPATLSDVLSAALPKLERLDLWLGSENYGFESAIEDFEPIFSGTKFPALKHLGLMDSEIQDEVAIAVSESAVLKQLETLDLSMGVLSDKGGEALLNSADVKKLSFLNLRHHFMSDNMMEQLKGLGIKINLDERDASAEDERYIEVSE
jgi:hypothetical protein